MKREIKYNGYTIKFDKVNSFEVLGNFNTIATTYKGIDGFITKLDKQYKMLIYLKQKNNIFYSEYSIKSFNDGVKRIKNYIKVFLIQDTIKINNINNFYCNFKYNTINTNSYDDCIKICNTLKKHNINFAVDRNFKGYSVKPLNKTIKATSDNTITF